MIDLSQKSSFLTRQASNGVIKIDVRFEEETVWLTQQATVQNFLTVRCEGLS